MKFTTAKMMGLIGNQVDLMDPYVNALVAARYLRHQLVRYKFNIPSAVAAYNSGTVKFDKSGDFINAHYVQKVFYILLEGRE